MVVYLSLKSKTGMIEWLISNTGNLCKPNYVGTSFVLNR